MKVNIYTRNAMAHHVKYCGALADGFKAIGVKANLIENGGVSACDVACMFGMHNPAAYNSGGKRVLLLEAAAFGPQLDMATLGWSQDSGMNGRAFFKNENSPGDRWDKYGVPVECWGHRKGPIVVMGQVQGDAATKQLDLLDWYKRVIRATQDCFRGHEIAFRPHPKGSAHRLGVRIISDRVPLEEMFEETYACITHNSRSAVEAVLAGVPTVAMDEGSFAYGMTTHGIGRWRTPDRTQWCYDLAYTQWTADELANGTALEHIWDYD